MAIISRRTLLSVAAALLYAPILVQATCDPKLSQGFNASGSATASILGGTWNITRYVSYQTGPNSTLYEPITVSAGPDVNLTSDAYEGCFIRAVGLQDPTQVVPITDDGTCGHFLGTVCIATLKANLRASPSSPSKAEYCDSFLDAISKSAATGACPAPILNALDAAPVPSFSKANSTEACPIKGSADKGSLLASAHLNSTANLGMYDQAIGAPTPLFISVREKRGTSGATVENMAIVCVPAGTVAAGSRTLADSAKEAAAAAAAKATENPGAAGRLAVEGWAVFGVVGVVGVASLVGMLI